jgi:hypothetical protein
MLYYLIFLLNIYIFIYFYKMYIKLLKKKKFKLTIEYLYWKKIYYKMHTLNKIKNLNKYYLN